MGKADGTITIWDMQTWSIKTVLRSEMGGAIVTLKYTTVKVSGASQTVLLVGGACVNVVVDVCIATVQ